MIVTVRLDGQRFTPFSMRCRLLYRQLCARPAVVISMLTRRDLRDIAADLLFNLLDDRR